MARQAILSMAMRGKAFSLDHRGWKAARKKKSCNEDRFLRKLLMALGATLRIPKSPCTPFGKGGWGDLQTNSSKVAMTITIAD